jgi:DNA invertase Pin-like site-specific DNA recombinase
MSAVRCACYVRVSTASKSRQGETTSLAQNPEVQEQPLRQLIAQRGWELYRVYSDRASGTKERRPGLDALMADARRGAFDVVVVWRFDRFARSVKQLVLALEEFRSLEIDFVSHQEALDTSTPMGMAMFTVIAAMAELERSVIRERVVAGLEYARQRGTRSGRPVGRPKAVFRRDQAPYLRAQGHSLREIARRLGTSVASVRRACQGQTRPRKRPKPSRRVLARVQELPRSGLRDSRIPLVSVFAARECCPILGAG